MKRGLLVKLLLIAILVGISSYFVYSKELILGLDLSGGSRLIFDADTTKIDTDKKETALTSLRNVVEKRVNFFGVSEPNVRISSFEGKNRIIVELPGINDPKEAVNLIGQTAQLNFVEVIDASPSAQIKETGVTGADIKASTIAFDPNTGKPVVSFEIKKESEEKFEDLTRSLIGKRMIILLDSTVITDAVVQDVIIETGQISGNFTLEEAKEISSLLNSGALPVPIRLVGEETIGATLGMDSINKSIKAGIVGLVMVSLFMILNYKKNGVIATIALLIFGVITLALYKLIPVVLTLPGIAGFTLSIGMAVDSNILIFERLKEEIKTKSLESALEVAFGRAWDSIRDANIATLVTAFILANPLEWEFLHVSGPVRGFAITLALGIAVSLFTGIFVTRNLMRLLIK
jgi:preprotein translocase subunit SecD